jgi:predicted P-loop ATPase/GTPase
MKTEGFVQALIMDSRLRACKAGFRGNDVSTSRLSFPPRMERGINSGGNPEDLKSKVLRRLIERLDKIVFKCWIKVKGKITIYLIISESYNLSRILTISSLAINVEVCKRM